MGGSLLINEILSWGSPTASYVKISLHLVVILVISSVLHVYLVWINISFERLTGVAGDITVHCWVWTTRIVACDLRKFLFGGGKGYNCTLIWTD